MFCDILMSPQQKGYKTTRKSYFVYEFTILSGGLPYDYAKFY